MTCRACSRTGQSHPSCQACATLYWKRRALEAESALAEASPDMWPPQRTVVRRGPVIVVEAERDD